MPARTSKAITEIGRKKCAVYGTGKSNVENMGYLTPHGQASFLTAGE